MVARHIPGVGHLPNATMTHDESHDRSPLPRRRMMQVTAAGVFGSVWGMNALAHARPTARAAKPAGRPTKTTPARPQAKATDTSSARPRAQPRGSAPTLAPMAASLSREEKAFAEALAERVKHAAVAAASMPSTSFARGSYARLTHRYLKKMPKAKRAAAKTEAKKLLAAPVQERTARLGSLANMAVADHKRQLSPVRPQMAKAATRVIKRRMSKAAGAASGVLSKLPYTNVGFYLNEVHCTEETDEIGADEIMISTILVAPDGTTRKTGPFTVSRDFDEGETKVFYKANHKKFDPKDPRRGRKLAAAPLGGAEFPGSWTLLVLMFERDDGGFGAFFRDLYAMVADEARVALMSASASMTGPLGAYIGELMSHILSGLLDFFAWLFHNPDDYIDDKQAILTLASDADAYFEGFNDSRDGAAPSNVWASKQQTMKFRGDGGRYEAKIHWRVWR